MHTARRWHIVIPMISCASFALIALVGCRDASTPGSSNVPAPTLTLDEELDPAAEEIIREKHESASAVPDDAGARIELAMAYHAHEMLEAARTAYGQAAQIDPDRPRAWYLLAQVQKQLGLEEEALSSMQRAADLEGTHAAAPAQLGFWLMERGRFEEARGAFERALAIDPAFVNGRIGAARIDLQQGRVDEAIAALESLRSGHPRDAYITYLLGMAYRQARRMDEARPLLEAGTGSSLSWAGQDPWMAEMQLMQRGYQVEYQRAQDYLAAGRPDLARPILQQLNENDPDDVVVLIALAGTYSTEQQFERALEILERAEAIDPDQFAVHLNLGSVYQRMGQPDKALHHTEEAIRLNESLGRGHFQRGQILFAMGRFADAEASLSKAVELDTENRNAHLLLVLALDRQGKRDETIEVLRTTIERFPNVPDPYLMPARIYHGLGRLEAAHETIVAAEQRFPDNEQVQQLKRSMGLP